MDIYICVGSSCHLKGSYNIIKKIEQLIVQHGVKDKVVLKASFCLGHCTKGVVAKIDDKLIIEGLSEQNVEEMFKKHVLDEMK